MINAEPIYFCELIAGLCNIQVLLEAYEKSVRNSELNVLIQSFHSVDKDFTIVL